MAAIWQGSPLDIDTMMGAQASALQMEKIMSYLEVGKDESAKVLIGGGRNQLWGELSGGFYIQPTLFKGTNDITAWAPACGRATAAAPIAWTGPSGPAA